MLMPIFLVLLILLITMMNMISVHGISKMIMNNSSNSSTICPESFQSCGNLSDIHYPFSLSPFSSCGYPGLTIFCLNDTPILRLNSTTIPTLSTDAYTITYINYTSNTFDLTYSNFLLINDYDIGDDDCPDIINSISNSNLTLDIHSFLSFTQADANLIFFLDCLEVLENNNSISCLNNGSKNSSSYVFFPPELPIPSYDLRCADMVVVPVLRQAVFDFIEQNPLGEVLGGVLKKGFQIAWDPAASLEECRTCEKSGGRCGFNVTGTGRLSTHWEITCFCSDGSQLRDSCGQKNRTKKKIIIGLCTGIGGFLLASALFFFWHRHQKRRERSPSSNPLMIPTYIETTSGREDPELGSPTYQTHFFSYQELQEATDSFSVSKELGDGGYGTVYKGKLRDGRTVAVKRLYNNNYKRVEQFLNEVKILSCLRHQNLVTLYGCTSPESQELLLVYEFVPNGTLADHLHGSKSQQRHLSWPVRMSIAIEIADVLAYLHAVEPPIIHRDVKTNNILLDNDFHVKVADFGLSRLCPTDATHVSTAPQGTPGYLDPEYHQCYQLTNKSDVYSFGVVLVELISSKHAVDLTRQPTEINLASMAIHMIEKCELDQLIDPVLGYQSDALVKMMVAQVAELAFRCLQGEKEMRPPIKEVLEVLKDIESKMLMHQNNEALSPDSVVDKWPSMNSTPGTSGKDGNT